MGTNLEGSMDGRLEGISESRREDLRLDGGGGMVICGLGESQGGGDGGMG